MMNGYSVTEAASVLGVPTERVWELLARGVLAGTPEGETGMRVFLQPRQAAAPIAATDEPAAAASNGPDRELSPFRELLTEFRNLTERYGQALLALGESRGEVASLRSRVDLLEARIDLRLPMGGAASSPWPTQSLPVTEPMASEARPEPAVEDSDEAHRPRPRAARRAVDSFAVAMARTEDPSPADLPPSTGAGGAAAGLADDTDRSLPRDVLPAEPMLVAEDEEAPAQAVALDEPEPSVDEAGPSVADLEPDVPEVIDEPLVAAEPAAADDDSELADVWEVDVEPSPDDVEEAPTDRDATVEADGEDPGLEAASAAMNVDEPTRTFDELDEPEPVEFDAARYSTAIEQPDWLEAEADDDVPAASPPAEAAAVEGPGADEMEVVGGGHPGGRTDDPADEALPGSRELDDALAVYGDFGSRSAAGPEPEGEWPPTRAAESPMASTSSPPPRFIPEPPRRVYGSVTSVGPANRAYRRLRRIFPT